MKTAKNNNGNRQDAKDAKNAKNDGRQRAAASWAARAGKRATRKDENPA